MYTRLGANVSPYYPRRRQRESDVDVGDVPWFDQTPLTSLVLANNELAALDDSLGCLEALMLLDLRNNALESLPEALAALTRLSILNVANNALGGTLPDSILALHALRELHVGGNKLEGLWSAESWQSSAADARGRLLDHSPGATPESAPAWSPGHAVSSPSTRQQDRRQLDDAFEALELRPLSTPFASLRVLDISQNALSATALADALCSLPPSLVTLRANGARSKYHERTALRASRGLRASEPRKPAEKGEDDGLSRGIAALARLPRLAMVELGNNMLTAAAFALNSPLPGQALFPALTRLGLSSNTLNVLSTLEQVLAVGSIREIVYSGVSDRRLENLLKRERLRDASTKLATDALPALEVDVGGNDLANEYDRRRELFLSGNSRAPPQATVSAAPAIDAPASTHAAVDSTRGETPVPEAVEDEEPVERSTTPSPENVPDAKVDQLPEEPTPVEDQVDTAAPHEAQDSAALALFCAALRVSPSSAISVALADRKLESLPVIVAANMQTRMVITERLKELVAAPDSSSSASIIVDAKRNKLQGLCASALHAYGAALAMAPPKELSRTASTLTLRTLDLSRNALLLEQFLPDLASKRDEETLAFELPGLVTLNLSTNKLTNTPAAGTDGAASLFARVARLAPRLESLDLSYNALTDVRDVAHVLAPQLPSSQERTTRQGVKELRLTGNKLADVSPMGECARSSEALGHAKAGWRCGTLALDGNSISRVRLFDVLNPFRGA